VTEDVPATLAESLVAALSTLETIGKGRRADAGSYSYAYADLDDVIRVTRPALAAVGVVALTPVHGHDGGYAVTVTLLHWTGEERSFDPLPFPRGGDARASGSGMTYFRRYALLAALGLATGDPDPIRDPGDDDGGVSVADPLPQARKRLGKVVHDLDEARRAELRGWLEENGLPDRPAKMDLAQCEAVADWIEGPT
jgi:hypothetical protein